MLSALLFIQVQNAMSLPVDRPGACHESAHQAHTALPASLDSFPRRRELDENPIFTNSYFLVEVDEAPGPLNHSFLIKGQPLRQEQHCLKLIFFFFKFSPRGPHGKHCPVLSAFTCQQQVCALRSLLDGQPFEKEASYNKFRR